MIFFVVFALALATASGAAVPSKHSAVHPRDLPAITGPEGRIVNGQKAAPGQIPYQIGLDADSPDGGWWCGGSLISPTVVLTAGHCTDGGTGATIYLGSTERSVAEVAVSVPSSSFRQHAGYQSSPLSNDISLVIIPAVSYSSKIQKINLPAPASSYVGQSARASGWGKTSDAELYAADHLYYVDLSVISNVQCLRYYRSNLVTPKVLCTSTEGGSKSTCSGDSGGPLAVGNVLVGVSSFVSSDGCESGGPAGFVRVTSYLDWIEANSGVSY